MQNTFKTREEWLNALAAGLTRDVFLKHCGEVPQNIRFTCGFPSVKAIGATKLRIGECWYAENSGDAHHEIMISPILASPMRVAGVLAHEMTHVIAGVECGHKGQFKRIAQAIGLEGKMTATTEGDAFIAAVQPILDAIGPYPHAELDTSGKSSGPKKQGTRLVKCECPECGYTVRTTRKWLEVGAPLCPAHSAMEFDPPDDTETESDPE